MPQKMASREHPLRGFPEKVLKACKGQEFGAGQGESRIHRVALGAQHDVEQLASYVSFLREGGAREDQG